MKKEPIYLFSSQPTYGNLLKYQISLKGFSHIHYFSSFHEFLYVLNKEPKPTFIIIDSGNFFQETLRFLQSWKPVSKGIFTIILSDNDGNRQAETLFEAGITDYILKSGSISNQVSEVVSNIQYLVKAGKDPDNYSTKS